VAKLDKCSPTEPKVGSSNHCTGKHLFFTNNGSSVGIQSFNQQMSAIKFCICLYCRWQIWYAGIISIYRLSSACMFISLRNFYRNL
jgi:hypothetical protein